MKIFKSGLDFFPLKIACSNEDQFREILYFALNKSSDYSRVLSLVLQKMNP